MAETADRPARRSPSPDPLTLGEPLAVPYDDRVEAARAGAVWVETDKLRCWFAPAGELPEALRKFRPSKEATISDAEARDEFLVVCREVGLLVDRLEDDGKMHRVPLADAKNNKANGAYWIELDGDRPHGYVMNWKTGEERSWVAGQQSDLTPEERAAFAAKMALSREKQERERIERQASVARKAKGIWKNGTLPPEGVNPYLQRKGVGAHGVRFSKKDGDLCVPMRDVDGNMSSLQFVAADGSKRFLSGGAKAGRMHVLGDLADAEWILVAEGYATAASLHEALGVPVACAFDAGNLLPVVEALRARHPEVGIAVMADNDRMAIIEGRANVGVEKAAAAAEAVDGIHLAPQFPDEVEGSDWNDLAAAIGLDAMGDQVREGFARLCAPDATDQAAAGATQPAETAPAGTPQAEQAEAAPEPQGAPEPNRAAIDPFAALAGADGVLVVEDPEAAAALAEATDLPTICLREPGGWLAMGQAVRERLPGAFIALMPSNDRAADPNGGRGPGVEQAAAAAAAIRGVFVAPGFPQGASGSSWTDLAAVAGFEAMRDQACARLAKLWGLWNDRCAQLLAEATGPAPEAARPGFDPVAISQRAGRQADPEPAGAHAREAAPPPRAATRQRAPERSAARALAP